MTDIDLDSLLEDTPTVSMLNVFETPVIPTADNVVVNGGDDVEDDVEDEVEAEDVEDEVVPVDAEPTPEPTPVIPEPTPVVAPAPVAEPAVPEIDEADELITKFEQTDHSLGEIQGIVDELPFAENQDDRIMILIRFMRKACAHLHLEAEKTVLMNNVLAK